MFCQNCGNELNEGAVFCPKCGEKIGMDQGLVEQYKQVFESKVADHTSFRKKRRWPMILLIAAVLAVAAWFVFDAGLLPFNNANRDKGADSPITVAKAYMSCILNADTADIEKYCDDNFNSSPYLLTLQDNLTEAAGIEINTDGITYDVGAEYTSFGYTCVDVEIHFSEKGFFGGNAIFGNSYTITLPLHKASTPDGEKWFMGKPKSSSGIYDDETGLM